MACMVISVRSSAFMGTRRLELPNGSPVRVRPQLAPAVGRERQFERHRGRYSVLGSPIAEAIVKRHALLSRFLADPASARVVKQLERTLLRSSPLWTAPPRRRSPCSVTIHLLITRLCV